MARSIAVIKAEMDAQQALEPSLSGLDSTSQTSIAELMKYIVASAIFLEETLLDIFKSEVQAIVDNYAVGTTQWLQQQVLKFQYSATNPQIVQLVNFVPGYNPVDETLRIITRCSVVTGGNRIVNIKVAKSEPPEVLTSSELASLRSYLTDIQFAGVQHNVTSNVSDKIYIEGIIYYNGSYSSVIEANVIAAINQYLTEIPFDGIVRASKIEDIIQSVPGVIDYNIRNLGVRADNSSYEYLVLNGDTVKITQTLYSGYVIEETNIGSTFTDTLTFTPQ